MPPRLDSRIALLVCGFASMVAITLQPGVVIRCAQMAVCIVLARIIGKRIRLLPPSLMLVAVVAANLLVPSGRVIASIWGFSVTDGALTAGLLKGSLLIALIYMSRISVRPGLRLPGAIGSMLVNVFAYFEMLNDGWRDTSGSLIARLDALLIRVHRQGCASSARGMKPEFQAKELIVAVFLVALSWGPYIYTLLA